MTKKFYLMKAFTSIALTISFLFLITSSCQKEEISMEDQLIGKWKLTNATIDGTAVVLSDCEKEETIDLQASNICRLYDSCSDVTTNSGWNYKSGMLNISEYLPAAFYIELVDKTSLRISRKDITAEGNLQQTILDYVKLQE